MFSVQKAASVSGGWVVSENDQVMAVKLNRNAAVQYCQTLSGHHCDGCVTPCGFGFMSTDLEAGAS